MTVNVPLNVPFPLEMADLQCSRLLKSFSREKKKKKKKNAQYFRIKAPSVTHTNTHTHVLSIKLHNSLLETQLK